jgi:hypothetical protein
MSRSESFRLTTCGSSCNRVLSTPLAGRRKVVFSSGSSRQFPAGGVDCSGAEHHHRVCMPAESTERLLADIL